MSGIPPDPEPPTIAEFRQIFSAFADETKYPDVVVTFWLNTAKRQLPPLRWATYWTLGCYLYTAHNLLLQAREGGAAGGGAVLGILSSKSVGPVSVSYDVGSVIDADAGQWNMTIYGARFWAMARLVGMGGVQVI